MEEMKYNPLRLLEQYVAGKDQDQYQILETIYEERAEVQFEINANTIAFPGKIIGNKAIAKELSADFNKKYEDIKTYYLSTAITDTSSILKQPWLVVMKEIGYELTRVGSGFYNWEFIECNNQLKIIKHKIYIHTMLEVPDPQSKQLMQIQGALDYPWAEKTVVSGVIESYDNLSEIAEYLKR